MGTAINGRAIDQVLADAVAAGRGPHVAADRDGILEGGAGVRIAGESDGPVTTSIQFRIMSVTKMVCTAAAVQQVERGEPDLGVPVDTYYPEFAGVAVLEGFDGDTPRLRPPAPRATVRQLITHTPGLACWFSARVPSARPRGWPACITARGAPGSTPSPRRSGLIP